MKEPIFIIEHLEPELWPWCIIEYESISKLVGKKNLWITNIKKKDVAKLTRFSRVFTQSLQHLTVDSSKACILDPRAPRTLSSKESFDYIILGGILGDEKLNGRTERELTTFFPNVAQRNIGKEQFSTDNAAYVAHTIAQGTPLTKIPFQDTLELHFNKVESVILPYRYPVINGKPRISPKLVTYLKKKKTF